MMFARVFPTALALALACSLGVEPAHADIYTWIDKSGTINVSNLHPPDGVKVTNVTREAPKPGSRDGSGDAPPPDVQLLAERVRQLEQEVEAAKRQPPPPYPVVDPPPTTYPVVPPPTVQYSYVQYQVIESPALSNGYAAPASYGCDPASWDCGTWWGPGFYPPAVFIVAPGFGRPFVPRGGPRSPMQKPGRAQGAIHRG